MTGKTRSDKENDKIRLIPEYERQIESLKSDLVAVCESASRVTEERDKAIELVAHLEGLVNANKPHKGGERN